MMSAVVSLLNEIAAWLAALALLAAAGGLGISVLRRTASDLDPLEQLAYGVPLGVVVASLVTLPLASALGFGASLVAVVGLASAVGALLVWPDRSSPTALLAAHL